MQFDFDHWANSTLLGDQPAVSFDEAADQAAWLWLERVEWVATPQLFFAMRELIREQMLGG